MSRFWIASLLVGLVSRDWMMVAEAAECNYVTLVMFPVATDSCVVVTNATGSYSSRATCTSNDANADIMVTYWNNGDCAGDIVRNETISQDDNSINATWVCDADNSGSDCDRTLYRAYSEEGCTNNEFYSEFYIVNGECVPTTNDVENGRSIMYNCENDVMFAQVYESDDCTGNALGQANFTSGCVEGRQRIEISCGGGNDDDTTIIDTTDEPIFNATTDEPLLNVTGDNINENDSGAIANCGSMSLIVFISSIFVAMFSS